jgi:hypothetical protein
MGSWASKEAAFFLDWEGWRAIPIKGSGSWAPLTSFDSEGTDFPAFFVPLLLKCIRTHV